MALKHTSTGLLSATTIAVSIPAGTAGAPPAPVPARLANVHGRGVPVVPAQPWRSHVDGGTDEAGDHWIVEAFIDPDPTFIRAAWSAVRR